MFAESTSSKTANMMYNNGYAATCNSGPLGPSLVDTCGTSEFFVFMSLLNALILKNEKISGKCDRVKPIHAPLGKYDFVVVGGGTAGSVVAARLSEIFDWKVLLLEAGPDEPAGAQIPAFAIQYLTTDIIWNYRTTNESHACLSTNGSCVWSTAKNLGGSSVHNCMLYLRSHPKDYDDWAELGNEGWSWREVKRYFLKAEDNGEIERVGKIHHATGGPLSVERFPYVPPIGKSILEAAIEAGHGVSDDINGNVKTGFTRVQAMNRKGVRRSTAAAYLRPIRDRKNLHVSLNSTVTKVIIKNGKAIGVEYYKDGKRSTVYATREVIISGGAVESPHLLLLSGIGPKEHLESFGIKVVKDLPGVGENLHDQPCATIPFTVNEPDVFDNDKAAAAEYLDSQSGPLSSCGLIQVPGLLTSTATRPDRPDIELYFHGYQATCAPGDIGALKSTGRRTVTLLPSYLYPKSRGRVTLASKNPFEHPLIWANYYGETEDVDRSIEAIRIIFKLLDTDALRPYNFTLSNAPLDACSHLKFQSDQYWTCVLKQSTSPSNHRAGSCKMGPATDRMAVVDPRLRVYGIKGLRVVDASIMPMVTGSNPAAPIIMIAERVSDHIKQDWNRL